MNSKYSREYLSEVRSLLSVLSQLEGKEEARIIEKAEPIEESIAEPIVETSINIDYVPKDSQNQTDGLQLSSQQKESSDMEFTIGFMKDFLNNLVEFDRFCVDFDNKASANLANRRINDEQQWQQLLEAQRGDVQVSVATKASAVAQYDSQLQKGSKESRESLWSEYHKESEGIFKQRNSKQKANDAVKSREKAGIASGLAALKVQQSTQKVQFVADKTAAFTKKFNPKAIGDKYEEIYDTEPFVEGYTCRRNNPSSVHIAGMTYDLAMLGLGKDALFLLESNYPALYRHGKLHVPFSLSFDEHFNYLFELNESNRKLLVDRACSLAMRLFMELPPNKVNFTFVDPITLGETFALFTRLVDVDDRTSKVINGKIWTSTADVDERLRVLTDHISNVTQRCLQGQYNNIQEYNAIAGQNAEPYQVLMIMDFPGSFKEDSLRMLEQIISTGPKCGVYTIILKNTEQVSKAEEKVIPLIKNIEAKMVRFVVKGKEIVLANDSFQDRPLTFSIKPLLSQGELNTVIPVLKDGIKNADKIVIPFADSLLPPEEEWFTGDCSKELIIPLGMHGANNIQNLAFGIGGHHALIAGQTGSGKSSLLHTIIMSSLLRYSADQLNIFLVDFKRGVEFKIYANHELEAFRAVAIESEREFGSSVLEFLDREQSRRADKFKRVDVDNVHDYRQKTGEVLPRIMLIIDEFHVLFSKDNDNMSKNAAAHLEQIIRQGRAFGLHVILASQTMTNVGGIHHGVWGQVGIRIALRCPKADARFILGADNDAVDLLSPTDPGQAVYNSDCGNVVANTIFRISYIEQDLQTQLLDKISANPKHRSTLQLPETRVMLSNVEDNIYNIFQKFARADDNQIRDIQFADNAVLVGEPLQLINNMQMNFRDRDSSNMLIIGNDEQKARTMFTFCSLSLALHTLTKNGHAKPKQPSIYIVDYAPLEDFYEKDVLLELVQPLSDYVKYVTFEESQEALEELYGELSARRKGSGQSADSKYFLLFGLQRARDLRNNELYQPRKTDDIGFDDGLGLEIQQKLNVSPYDMFLNILQSGASNGIHSIIWADNFKTFMAHYAGMLANFDLRIGFTMPDDDSVLFIEEPSGSQINENNAVFSYNRNQKFRPYKKPDLDWLKNICERIAKF